MTADLCKCLHGIEQHLARNGQRQFCLRRGCRCLHYRADISANEQERNR
jgi:hypothetical protein